MKFQKLMVLPLVLCIFAWAAEGVLPVLAQESDQKAEVAPAIAQPAKAQVSAPAVPQAKESASMEKVGHAGATFGKETGNFFGTAGKKTGCFFKNAGVKTGHFFKGLFVKD